MRDELIGYLLGALDEDLRVQVEQRLRSDANLRADMETLRRGLQVLQGPRWQDPSEFDRPASDSCGADRIRDDISVEQILRTERDPLAPHAMWVEPPVGLAERACDFVFSKAPGGTSVIGEPASQTPAQGGLGNNDLGNSDLGRRFRSGPEPAVGSFSWSVADAFVVAGVCITAALLFAPALITSRISAQRQLCASRLRDLGEAFALYSAQHQDELPVIPTSGPRGFAGIYAPVLRDAGLLSDPNWIICPESHAVDSTRVHNLAPTLSQIDRGTANDLDWCRAAGGSYAYALPYLDQHGQRVSRKNLRQSNFAILGDIVTTPSAPGAPAIQVLPATAGRHGGRGANVLFQDGGVRYQHQLRIGNDDLFRSNRGLVEVGQSIDDQVLAPSQFQP
ncbi:MAG: hypothetical protein O2931_01925 [Planctomycetota bacterium]|nr:hypothetical protein [Planctomycetota bacterium]MDA1177531.1 hypothetical protein [Planctomycetota bacterium]